MRVQLANLNHCAVPFLSRAVANLSWYDYSTKLRDTRNYAVIFLRFTDNNCARGQWLSIILTITPNSNPDPIIHTRNCRHAIAC